MATHKADLTDLRFKTAFLDDKLLIECSEIKLTEARATNPRVYCAPGVIEVGVKTGAKSCIVCKRDPSEHFNPMESIQRSMSLKSGQLIPDHYYFRLEATDGDGNVWTNPAVSLHIQHNVASDEVRFECARIETELSTSANTTFARLVFADKVDFPENRMVTRYSDPECTKLKSIRHEGSEGQVGNLNLLFTKIDRPTAQEGYEFEAVASQTDAVHEHFDIRLLEAVQFCTATLVWPVMSEVAHEGRRVLALSTHRPPNKGLVAAPLSNQEAATDFYGLMERYYTHACKDAKGDELSAISKRVGGLFTLKGVWLDSVALLLSVTAEGLLQQDPFKAMSVVAKPMKKLVKRISDAATGMPEMVELTKEYDKLTIGTGVRSLEDRMRGLLQLMSSGRVLDTMWVLHKAGAISSAEIQSWEELRNAGAHGSLEVDETRVQEYVDHMHRVMTMIYKIVFLHIGYKGRYSNFGEHGWACAEFDGPTYRQALGL